VLLGRTFVFGPHTKTLKIYLKTFKNFFKPSFFQPCLQVHLLNVCCYRLCLYNL